MDIEPGKRYRSNRTGHMVRVTSARMVSYEVVDDGGYQFYELIDTFQQNYTPENGVPTFEDDHGNGDAARSEEDVHEPE